MHMPWGGGGGSYGAVELAFLRHCAVLPFWGVDFTSLVQRNVFLHFMYLFKMERAQADEIYSLGGRVARWWGGWLLRLGDSPLPP